MSSSRCAQGAIRLANKTQTSTLLQGRLEVCDSGEWKVVCYSGPSSRRQRELICNELFTGYFLGGNVFMWMLHDFHFIITEAQVAVFE